MRTASPGQGGDHRHRPVICSMLRRQYLGAPIASRGLWGTHPADPPSIGCWCSARVRDYRDHYYVSHVHIEFGGKEEQTSDGIQEEDRDLPLRVGDPAVISAASGYVPLIAERLPPVAIANFSKSKSTLSMKTQKADA